MPLTGMEFSGVSTSNNAAYGLMPSLEGGGVYDYITLSDVHHKNAPMAPPPLPPPRDAWRESGYVIPELYTAPPTQHYKDGCPPSKASLYQDDEDGYVISNLTWPTAVDDSRYVASDRLSSAIKETDQHATSHHKVEQPPKPPPRSPQERRGRNHK